MMHFLKLLKLGIQWISKMNKDKVEAEHKKLIELQNVSEKISDLISEGKFQTIIPLEKQRLEILKSFNVKPSDSGIKLLQNILEKTKKDIDIIENEKKVEGSFYINTRKRLNKKLLINITKKLFSKGISKSLIIHHSKESLYISREEVIHTSSKSINRKKIINSVGAGDAFCAAFIYGVHESWDMKKILKKAHAAGSAMMKIDSSSGNLPNMKKL